MFESYLFIPANKKKFIDKSSRLVNLDYRIFDLEDSVVKKDLILAIDNLRRTKIFNSDWVRIPIGKTGTDQIIRVVHELGFNNYVIPKFEGYKDFENIYNDIYSVNKQTRLILLLENPKAYLDLEKILAAFSSSIYGVSLGIHDFTYETGMKNDYKLLRNIRTNIMLTAKAYSVIPLDVASMFYKDKKWLEEEILDGFNLGYRGKLFIHPYQLEVLRSVEFYTKSQIEEYERVIKYFTENIQYEDIIFSFNGRVYEKMHIKEIIKVVEWGRTFYGTNR